MGEDKRLARWDEIVEYFWHLDEYSPCVSVNELGQTTEGNPFLLTIISSPENLQEIDHLRKINTRLAHRKDISDQEVDELVEEGKVFISNTMSLHASEVGGTQTSSELAFELATSSREEIEKVRHDTVLLLIPCANPDGNKMVVDWYRKWRDTEYEGVPLPYLYHKYAGHDNNKDAFKLTQKESKLLANFFYSWFPQATIDYHQMRSFGARFNIPPKADPIYEHADPLIWTEQQLFGSKMLLDLESNGKKGIETQCTFPGEMNPAWEDAPALHNICGMLTESASVKLASPIYIHSQQLQEGTRGRPEYRPQIGFPHPWEGGWWRLRDIVEQQKISSIAALKVAAENREQLLRNMYRKASRQIRLGEKESPYAYILDPKQHDKLTALKFLQKLQMADVEIHCATQSFKVNNTTYPAGTYVIFLSQYCRPYILRLIKRTFYHDGPITRKADETPLVPYDLATGTLAEFMGVNFIEVEEPFKGNFKVCKTISFPQGKVVQSENGYLLDPRLNETFKVVNKLLKNKIDVYRVHKAVDNFPKGGFYIAAQSGYQDTLRKLAKQHHVIFHPVSSTEFKKEQIKPKKVGIYRRYWGGNTDEGWTRWLLEQYGFEYSRIQDKEIKQGELNEAYDVIILPDDLECLITGENIESYFQKHRPHYVKPTYPPKYRSGIGKTGVETLQEFVENGGTLLSIGRTSKFIIETFDLPIRNPLKDLSSKEFLCPGSTLETNVNTEHSLAYGLDEDAYLLFGYSTRDYPVFELRHTAESEKYQIVMSFPEERLLQSGWLVGEKYLANKATLIDAKKGTGRIILYAFHPQFRAQTSATFKVLFNALYT